jgi:hypothetical protein
MKNKHLLNISLSVISLLALLTPLAAIAQTEATQSGPPPVAAPLIREGELAINLASSLGIITGSDEIEAENRLADVGISPRNGWIADYPVTPDIIGELQQAVGTAADAGKIPLSREEALKRLNDALNGYNMSIAAYAPTGSAEPPPASAENYPNPGVVNNYYYTEGPPVMTYYTPPPDFYYLYGFIPYPFWWSGFWFPGFFVLNDFHKTVVINRRPVFVSNHFRDIRNHRVFRIDPAARFHGRTFGGIGASRSGGFISTGVPRSDRRIFNSPSVNAPRGFNAPSPGPPSRMAAPPSRGAVPARPSARGEMSSPVPQGRMASPPSQVGGASGGRRGGVRR